MNNNIKQLIEGLFDDDIFDNIDNLSISDKLLNKDEDYIFNWLNEHVDIYEYKWNMTRQGFTKGQNIIFDRSDNKITCKIQTNERVDFHDEIPDFVNITSIKASKVTFDGVNNLYNMPKEIIGDLIITHYDRETLPFEMPEVVGGELLFIRCPHLKTLNGLSNTCKEVLSLRIDSCPEYEDTLGIPEKSYNFIVTGCNNIKELTNIPDSVNHVSLTFLHSLTSIKGLPKILLSDLYIYDCPIKTLRDCPSYIGGDFSAILCGLESLDMKNSHCKINGSFNVSNNLLKDLSNGPLEIGRNYICNKNKLKYLNASCTTMAGYDVTFDCTSNPRLKNLDNFPNCDKRHVNIKHNKLKDNKR